MGAGFGGGGMPKVFINTGSGGVPPGVFVGEIPGNGGGAFPGFGFNGWGTNFRGGNGEPSWTDIADNESLYKVLELKGKDKPSSADIKKAYHRLAKIHHTDKGGDADTIKRLNRAYEVLSDPRKRNVYDNAGEQAVEKFEAREAMRGPGDDGGGGGGGSNNSGSGGGGFPFSGFPFGGFPGDGFSFPGFSTDGGSAEREPPQTTPAVRVPPPVETSIHISFATAYTGCTETVTFARRNVDGTEETADVTVDVPPGVTSGYPILVEYMGHETPGVTDTTPTSVPRRGHVLVMVGVQDTYQGFVRKGADLVRPIVLSWLDTLTGTTSTFAKALVDCTTGAASDAVVAFPGRCTLHTGSVVEVPKAGLPILDGGGDRGSLVFTITVQPMPDFITDTTLAQAARLLSGNPSSEDSDKGEEKDDEEDGDKDGADGTADSTTDDATAKPRPLEAVLAKANVALDRARRVEEALSIHKSDVQRRAGSLAGGFRPAGNTGPRMQRA